ncbi:protein-transporting protein BCP1 [Rhodotorula paludigena]|uniref:protein-transporting protein BCP1 n=1 Tax=Rhodotorula paludigena TaxID=86838 RepID=UPI00317970D7
MGKKTQSAAAATGMDVDEPQRAPAAAGPKENKSKRRGRDEDDDDDDDDDDGAGTDTEMLDVSFSFFDPQPQDYHSIKLLLSQLVQGDAQLLDLGAVTDLVLEQKLVGSTVKTDGGADDDKAAQGDPYAVLTVLNLNVHKEHKALSQLVSYLVSKLAPASPFHSQLSQLLAAAPDASTAAKPAHVGLVLSERLVNMPAQIVPPMYRMLDEELQWARDDKEPYHFSHLLFLSRVFRSSTSALDDDPNAALEASLVAEQSVRAAHRPRKKKSRAGQGAAGERDEERDWVYHAEDEVVQKLATHSHVFEYTNSRRQAGGVGGEAGEGDFGVHVRGQLLLVPWAKWGELVQGIDRLITMGV